jgi:hypothetical protein
LKEEQFEKLLPFLHRKEPRQRVILYLIAAGYSASDLLAMSVADIRALKLPASMEIYRDEMLYGLKKGPAFLYPNGKPIDVPACKRLVREKTATVLGEALSLEQFRAYIQSTKRSK